MIHESMYSLRSYFMTHYCLNIHDSWISSSFHAHVSQIIVPKMFHRFLFPACLCTCFLTLVDSKYKMVKSRLKLTVSTVESEIKLTVSTVQLSLNLS